MGSNDHPINTIQCIRVILLEQFLKNWSFYDIRFFWWAGARDRVLEGSRGSNRTIVLKMTMLLTCDATGYPGALGKWSRWTGNAEVKLSQCSTEFQPQVALMIWVVRSLRTKLGRVRSETECSSSGASCVCCSFFRVLLCAGNNVCLI